MKVARVLLWLDCNRNCPGCCNNYKSLTKQRRDIKLEDLKDFDTICLTGGEPLLYPDKLISIIKRLRVINSNAKIYLYTALYKPEMRQIIWLVDGIQYSLHYPMSIDDRDGFEQFQYDILYMDGSYRAYIDSRIERLIPIHPDRWTRVEIKPWIKEGNCPLPKDEQLFLLKE